MSVAARPVFAFAPSSFVRELEGLYVPWQAAAAPAPRALVVDDAVADELGVDPAVLRSEAGVAILAGTTVPEGTTPVAMAYAGHQFGGYSPRLGDGRALLVGELVDRSGQRRDLHLKGSGRTPFARGTADGKAAVGPMLREHVVSEAMHALGIPTTRALAVVATGEDVARETLLPGAVLARVAASHLRVGTFEYAARLPDPDVLRRLTDYAIARHWPDAAGADRPALALLEAVVDAQASLVASWMLVGFVHGVMNTDNMAISGETIDYGPCAFLDAYDPATVFSSIDRGGRYAYANQPAAAAWNLARLAETLLPLIDPVGETAIALATGALDRFPERYEQARLDGMRTKLGLAEPSQDDAALVTDLLEVMSAEQADWTSTFRALSASLRDEGEAPLGAAWLDRWRARHPDPDAMDRVNPAVIPRNHLVDEALIAATAGDLAPYERLVDAVRSPFEARTGYTEPAPAGDGPFRTYCGT